MACANEQVLHVIAVAAFLTIVLTFAVQVWNGIRLLDYVLNQQGRQRVSWRKAQWLALVGRLSEFSGAKRYRRTWAVLGIAALVFIAANLARDLF